MERISIFNYEAFYLDHLEGNLNEEDTALLLIFLSNHPELAVELNEMPLLSIEEELFKTPSFQDLKQVDYDSDVITSENFETFAIAHVENQLSEAKKQELSLFVEQNENAKMILVTFEATKLIPDNTIVFEGKSGLKQKQKIVAWRYVAAAAVFVGFLFMAQIWMGNVNTNPQEVFAFEKLDRKLINEGHRLKSNSTPVEGVGTELVGARTFKRSSNSNTSNDVKVVLNKVDDLQFAQVTAKKIKLSDYQAKDGIKIIEYPLRPINQLAQETNENPTMAYSNMSNPIKPITNRLSDFTKTEIDVRTAKATGDSRGGFYLKVGKLEIERPSRKAH